MGKLANWSSLAVAKCVIIAPSLLFAGVLWGVSSSWILAVASGAVLITAALFLSNNPSEGSDDE